MVRRLLLISGVGGGQIVTNPLDPDNPNQPPPPSTTPGLGTGGLITIGGSGGSSSPAYRDINNDPVPNFFPPSGNDITPISEPGGTPLAWQFTRQFPINGGTRIQSWIVGFYPATMSFDVAESELDPLPGLPLARIWEDTFYDSGGTFGSLDNGGLVGFPLTIYAEHRGELFSAQDNTGNVVKSTDGGDTWNPIANQPSLTLEDGYQMVSTYGTLVVSGYDQAHFTRDKGVTWTAINVDSDGEDFIKIAVGDNDHWALMTSSFLFVSTDDAATWTRYTLSDLGTINGTFSNIAWSSDILVLIGDDLNVYRLTGTTWSSGIDVSNSNPDIDQNVAPQHSVFLGALDEMLLVPVTDSQYGSPSPYGLRSADRGVTWKGVDLLS